MVCCREWQGLFDREIGAKVLELAKGKGAVEVTSPEELINTLETIKAAVEAGELDGQIEAASQSLSAGFQK